MQLNIVRASVGLAGCSLVAVVATLGATAAVPHATAAGGAAASAHERPAGPRPQHGYVFENFKVPVHHRMCRNVVLNGLTDGGVILGTAFCGAPTTFTLTKSGEETTYRLPRKDGRFTLGGDIASSGALALIGESPHRAPQSFIWHQYGEAEQIRSDDGGRLYSVTATGINDENRVVGTYCEHRKCRLPASFSYEQHSFMGAGGSNSRTLLDVITDVNNHDHIAGYEYDRSLRIHGLVQTQWATRRFNAPHRGRGKFQGTIVESLATNGSFAGFTVRPHDRIRGFVHRHGRGYTTFSLGAAKKTGNVITGVNSAGEVIGAYRRVHSRRLVPFVGVPRHGKARLPRLTPKPKPAPSSPPRPAPTPSPSPTQTVLPLRRH